MADIAVPDPDNLILDGPRRNAPAQVNRSKWTGARKVIGLPGASTWSGTITIDTIETEEDERAWRAFLAQLENQANSFRWLLPRNDHIGPKPTVAAGATSGFTLPLIGMQPNARIARAGQYLTVPLPSGRNRSVCLVTDLRGDASGNATASFRPDLGEVPTAGATVETVQPWIDMAPTQDSLGLTFNDGVSGTSFDVEEAR